MRPISWKAGLAAAALVVTTRLCGCANGPRANAAGANATGADAGNDEADEPNDGSLQHHDAGWPAPPQGRACHAGEEGLNSASPPTTCVSQ